MEFFGNTMVFIESLILFIFSVCHIKMELDWVPSQAKLSIFLASIIMIMSIFGLCITATYFIEIS